MDSPGSADAGRNLATAFMLKMIFGLLENSDPRYASAAVRESIESNLTELMRKNNLDDATKQGALDFIADVFGA